MDIKHEIWKLNISAWIDLDENPYLESINILLNSNIDYEFRTTVIKWVHTEENIKNISKYISWAKNYYLQNYKSWNTLDQNFKWESFSEEELLKFKKVSEHFVKKMWIRN
jgi:pyruvate formate lyase activating enzyme